MFSILSTFFSFRVKVTVEMANKGGRKLQLSCKCISTKSARPLPWRIYCSSFIWRWLVLFLSLPMPITFLRNFVWDPTVGKWTFLVEILEFPAPFFWFPRLSLPMSICHRLLPCAIGNPYSIVASTVYSYLLLMFAIWRYVEEGDRNGCHCVDN